MTSSNRNQRITKTEGRGRSGVKTAGAASIAGSIVFGMLAFSGILPALAAEPSVPLGTTEGYTVLAGSTVTNTGPSVLNKSIGLHPGSAVVGFPPGIVNGVIDAANGPALQAKSDLTIAYDNAAGRSVTAAVPADLTGTTLVGGVYKSDVGPLALAGELTLDGANDPNSVFIFQTDSTLITGSASRINLINNAQACNVFWQVGSSATLGSGSSFVGTVMALTSVTAENGAAIEGRTFARNGAVTLDNNVFSDPSCDTTVDEPVEEEPVEPVEPGDDGTPVEPVVPGDDGTPGDGETPGDSGTPVDQENPPVIIPDNPGIIITDEENPPVIIPHNPGITITDGDTPTSPETPGITISDGENPPTSGDSSKELAETGLSSSTAIFGSAGILLLLGGLGFILTGRKNSIIS